MNKYFYFAALITLVITGGVRADDTSAILIESVVLRPIQEAEVPARQTGLLKAFEVAEGQVVEAGQVLATLDSRQAKLDLAKAKILSIQAEAKANNLVHVQYAQKALEVAKAELRRSEESIEKFPKSISQSQIDVEQLTIQKLELEIQQAEHELVLARFDQKLAQNEITAAQLNLSLHQLRAPFPGTVVLMRGRIGEWVENGSPVLRLVNTHRLRAEGFLPADVATAALLGKSVQFISENKKPLAEVTGSVRFVSPEMDPVTRQVRVWVELQASSGVLRPGQQGSIKILTQ